jgi:hypothetical protein
VHWNWRDIDVPTIAELPSPSKKRLAIVVADIRDDALRKETFPQRILNLSYIYFFLLRCDRFDRSNSLFKEIIQLISFRQYVD